MSEQVTSVTFDDVVNVMGEFGDYPHPRRR